MHTRTRCSKCHQEKRSKTNQRQLTSHMPAGQGMNIIVWLKKSLQYICKWNLETFSLFILYVNRSVYCQIISWDETALSYYNKMCIKIISLSSLVLFFSVLGPEVVGIWPRNAGNADVNTCHVSNTGNSVASGDDYGTVKLYNFPCREKDVSEWLNKTGNDSC